MDGGDDQYTPEPFQYNPYFNDPDEPVDPWGLLVDGGDDYTGYAGYGEYWDYDSDTDEIYQNPET
jgi:hypothetical protein